MAIIINRIGLLNVSIDRSIDSFLTVWHHFIYRILSTLLYKFQHFDLFFKHNLIVHRLSTRVFLPHFVSSFQILILIRIVREREELREKERKRDRERERVCVCETHVRTERKTCGMEQWNTSASQLKYHYNFSSIQSIQQFNHWYIFVSYHNITNVKPNKNYFCRVICAFVCAWFMVFRFRCAKIMCRTNEESKERENNTKRLNKKQKETI